MALTPSKTGGKADDKQNKIAAEDEVLLREIDDAVRQDDYADFAKRFGVPIVGAVVLGLAGFGGYLFWQGQQEAAMEAESEQLIAVLDQYEAGNLSEADAAASTLEESSEGGAAVLAQMTKAAIAVEQGRGAEAAAIYGTIAANGDAPEAFRNLALVRQVALTFDEREPSDVIAKLGPLAVPGNAWFGSAGELVALAHLENGDQAQAGTLLSEISKSEDVPESLRARARQLAGLLGVDAIEDVDELLEEQGITRSGERDAGAGLE
ncbi:tetratricopeptide repeat protein [Altererythrobacter lutimaris]|uniref:Tetratricopeptide repeat protein n=1 Tax=Altererythrobacter lutimaris TaxID=2743979 RepID=A0A850H5K1_9SPHN|nr:tetratricopeptide repeat protein [Altererythrobacter lutimaris]